jgi:hypothetical protein
MAETQGAEPTEAPEATSAGAEQVAELRRRAEKREGARKERTLLAADLLEMHLSTGIDLHTFPVAQAFVERFIGKPVAEVAA